MPTCPNLDGGGVKCAARALDRWRGRDISSAIALQTIQFVATPKYKRYAPAG